jgi:hypothetical protein
MADERVYLMADV